VPFLAGTFGAIYLVAVLVCGAAFLVLAVRLRGGAGRRPAALVFHYSLLYLALLFVSAAADSVI
ncbi:MAG: heme o synthase, partial [Gaiellaceae bacterium]